MFFLTDSPIPVLAGYRVSSKSAYSRKIRKHVVDERELGEDVDELTKDDGVERRSFGAKSHG